jgi:hypothetical protein
MAAKVSDPDLVPRDIPQHSLPFRVNDRSQHVMARDELVYRRAQASDVEVHALVLVIEAASDIAQLNEAGTSDPVGLLHLAEREGKIPIFGAGSQLWKRRFRNSAFPVHLEAPEACLKHLPYELSASVL